MTTERERLQIAGELRDMLEALQEETPPEYDPAAEITITDLARELGAKRQRIERMVAAKVAAGELVGRDVIANGRRAKAYRPVEK
jgi:DNA-binding MarR family transcriptional regulator